MGREPPLADGQVHRSRRFAAVAGLGQCEWSTRFIAGAPLAALAVESPAGRKCRQRALDRLLPRPGAGGLLRTEMASSSSPELFFLYTSCVT